MNKASYRPTYHASVPSGWGNDPNGTIFWHGRAHLFYQHYPHKPEWGTMHWGHFVTDDFVRWEALPVALVPDQDYEAICGCCSGSAVDVDGKLTLFYTAAQPDRQRQCVAVSDDGITFQKDPDNPILTAEMLSPELSPRDFRDPRVFERDGRWYMLAGVRVVDAQAGLTAFPASTQPAPDPDAQPRSPSIGDVSGIDPDAAGFGNLALLSSRDLRAWSYVGRLLRPQPELDDAFFHLNGVYECPDFIELDGAQVLLSSPQNLPQMGWSYQNVHSALYMLGALDFDTGAFHIDAIGELDHGFDFYAAQTLRMPDGRVILMAWKEMWERAFPTQSEGFAGTYSLPRELRVEDGTLLQRPVREIEAYRRNPVRVDALDVDGEAEVNGICGKTLELSLTLRPGDAARAGIGLFVGSRHATRLYYERATGLLVFDRSRSGLPITGREADVDRRVCAIGPADAIRLRIFLDVSSIEVFIDGGRRVMTGNVYPDPGDVGVTFFAEDGRCRFEGIEKYDIIVA